MVKCYAMMMGMMDMAMMPMPTTLCAPASQHKLGWPVHGPKPRSGKRRRRFPLFFCEERRKGMWRSLTRRAGGRQPPSPL